MVPAESTYTNDTCANCTFVSQTSIFSEERFSRKGYDAAVSGM
jgi:hypothetical protein